MISYRLGKIVGENATWDNECPGCHSMELDRFTGYAECLDCGDTFATDSYGNLILDGFDEGEWLMGNGVKGTEQTNLPAVIVSKKLGSLKRLVRREVIDFILSREKYLFKKSEPRIINPLITLSNVVVENNSVIFDLEAVGSVSGVLISTKIDEKYEWEFFKEHFHAWSEVFYADRKTS